MIRTLLGSALRMSAELAADPEEVCALLNRALNTPFDASEPAMLVCNFTPCDDSPSYVTIKTFRPKAWT